MGVLERLDREAREARERRQAAAQARAQVVRDATARLAPALARARRYLERLAARLNELDRAVSARYELPEVGALADLRQGPYRVTPAHEVHGAVRLLFDCKGSKPVEAHIQGHARAQALARTLREARLRSHLQPLSPRVMRLRVDPVVPVRVELAADLDKGVVLLTLGNLLGLGSQRHALAPERVDEDLLDALGRIIVREASDFARLTGSVVDDHRRAALQRELQRQRRRRGAELSGGLRQAVFPITEWFRRRFLGG